MWSEKKSVVNMTHPGCVGWLVLGRSDFLVLYWLCSLLVGHFQLSREYFVRVPELEYSG